MGRYAQPRPRPIATGDLQRHEHFPICAAEVLQPGAIVRGDPLVRVKVDPVQMGLPRPTGHVDGPVPPAARASHPRPGVRAKGQPALDRRAAKLRQHPRGLREAVRGARRVFARRESPVHQESSDPTPDRGRHLGHGRVARRMDRVERELGPPARPARAVEDQRCDAGLRQRADRARDREPATGRPQGRARPGQPPPPRL